MNIRGSGNVPGIVGGAEEAPADVWSNPIWPMGVVAQPVNESTDVISGFAPASPLG